MKLDRIPHRIESFAVILFCDDDEDDYWLQPEHQLKNTGFRRWHSSRWWRGRAKNTSHNQLQTNYGLLDTEFGDGNVNFFRLLACYFEVAAQQHHITVHK